MNTITCSHCCLATGPLVDGKGDIFDSVLDGDGFWQQM